MNKYKATIQYKDGDDLKEFVFESEAENMNSFWKKIVSEERKIDCDVISRKVSVIT